MTVLPPRVRGEADLLLARAIDERVLERIAAFAIGPRHRLVEGGGQRGQLALDKAWPARATPRRHGATGMSSSGTVPSGISSAGSKTDSVPSPSQTGHAPCGLLKEKWRGVISA